MQRCGERAQAKLSTQCAKINENKKLKLRLPIEPVQNGFASIEGQYICVRNYYFFLKKI